MALLKIDGVDMPTPSSLTVGIQDIVKAERNARGNMIMERIATKDKIELEWSYLTPTQLSQVLNAVSSVFFSVTYTNPKTNSLRTASFYVGDRSIPILDFVGGKIRYTNIKFNIVEK